MTKKDKELFSTACIIEPNKDEPLFIDIPEGINLKTFIGYEPQFTFMLPPFNNYMLVYNPNEKNKIDDNYNFFYFTSMYYGKVCLLKIEENEEGTIIATLTPDDRIELIARIYQLKHDQINDKLKQAVKEMGVDTVTSLLIETAKKLSKDLDADNDNAKLVKEEKELLITDLERKLSNQLNHDIIKSDNGKNGDDDDNEE